MSDLLESFKERASESGILLDFDGTLSSIVDIPSEARPLAGVAETLSALAQRYRWVAIVSGRSHARVGAVARSRSRHLGCPRGRTQSTRRRRGQTLAGRVPFRRTDVAGSRRSRGSGSAIRHPRSAGGGQVGDDRTSFPRRGGPRRAQEVLDELASELAQKYDLWRAEGRMAFELRPPVRFSKGDVVEALARELGLQAILFAGDDIVDLPGFDTLDELAAAGVMGVRIAVLSAEAPAELVSRADLTVEGPAGMLELLRRLL